LLRGYFLKKEKKTANIVGQISATNVCLPDSLFLAQLAKLFFADFQFHWNSMIKLSNFTFFLLLSEFECAHLRGTI